VSGPLGPVGLAVLLAGVEAPPSADTAAVLTASIEAGTARAMKSPIRRRARSVLCRPLRATAILPW
jgi:hypothetical protein